MRKAEICEVCGCGENMECGKESGYVVTEYIKEACETYEKRFY